MIALNYKNLHSSPELCDRSASSFLQNKKVERVMQIGEGNFLRGFVDYFIDLANEHADFQTSVVVVQPIAHGLAHVLNEQDGLYNVYLRGLDQGKRYEEKRLISCISRAIDPYTDYQALLDCAKQREIRYIVSNTTEAGIVFDADCAFDDTPPASFPAKLTRALYERYTAYPEQPPGVVVLSCELIDNNGAELRRCVQEYCALWNLSTDFCSWLDNENLFCSTLVDRIITGYPAQEADQLNAQNGYEDRLMVTGEKFGLWVIEGPEWLDKELPFRQAGLPVIVTNDHSPYKQRKVRILNGLHTTMTPVAFLYGKDIVRDSVEEPLIRSFMDSAVSSEIIPTLTLPQEELIAFAVSVFDRFKNPFIDHQLLSIMLNAVSKWRARVLPTVKDYLALNGKLPVCLCFGFAALLKFYRIIEADGSHMLGMRGDMHYTLLDDSAVLDRFYQLRMYDNKAYAAAICADRTLWGVSLDEIQGFTEIITHMLKDIEEQGIKTALEEWLRAK